MNELLDELQATDPDFAKTVKRLRFVSIALAIAIFIALVAGAYAIIVNGQQDTQIKRIEKLSACEAEAKSYGCQHTKQESSRAASTYTTCIPFEKVGYPCPKPDSGITIKPSEHASSSGGDALQPGSSGHQQPGPPSSGPSGGTKEPEPSEPAPQPEPAPEPQPKPKSGLLTPVLEGVCTTADRLADLC